MRSTAWIGSGAALGLPLLGISLGAALAGLVALGGAGGASAQGMMMTTEGYGYRGGKAVTGYRPAVQPAVPVMGYTYGPAPRAKGYTYRPAPRRAPRAKRYFYRSPAVKTCGQFKYWSPAKRSCLDARTTPPDLKPRL